MAWRGIIEQYRSFLPVTPKTPVVTLGEGNTPLVRAPRLADACNGKIRPPVLLAAPGEGCEGRHGEADERESEDLAPLSVTRREGSACPPGEGARENGDGEQEAQEPSAGHRKMAMAKA